jgi:hypothetical protein
MKSLNLLLATVLAQATLWGCGDGSTDPINIGDQESLGSKLSDYSGSWNGYTEAFKFADSKDRFRITLNNLGVGHLEAGDTAPLPPPDPDRGYPPVELYNNLQGLTSLTGFEGMVAPGFRYPIRSAVVEKSRIRLTVLSEELYREWCSAMTPILDDANSNENGNPEVFSCVPNDAAMCNQESCLVGGVLVDAAKFRLCPSVCECTSTACAIYPDSADDILFDGTIEQQGETLVGTLLLRGQRITVRMKRS